MEVLKKVKLGIDYFGHQYNGRFFKFQLFTFCKSLQISMSVWKAVMVVMRMPTVPILKEATTVPASLATLEMEEYAQVYFTTCLANQLKFTQFQSFFLFK